MKLLQEDLDIKKLPEESKYVEWQTFYYGIGEEVILLQVIDEHNCYATDKIRSVEISDNGVIYYFEESEKAVHQSDIIPYNHKTISELREQGYEWVTPSMIAD